MKERVNPSNFLMTALWVAVGVVIGKVLWEVIAWLMH